MEPARYVAFILDRMAALNPSSFPGLGTWAVQYPSAVTHGSCSKPWAASTPLHLPLHPPPRPLAFQGEEPYSKRYSPIPTSPRTLGILPPKCPCPISLKVLSKLGGVPCTVTQGSSILDLKLEYEGFRLGLRRDF